MYEEQEREIPRHAWVMKNFLTLFENYRTISDKGLKLEATRNFYNIFYFWLLYKFGKFVSVTLTEKKE